MALREITGWFWTRVRGIVSRLLQRHQFPHCFHFRWDLSVGLPIGWLLLFLWCFRNEKSYYPICLCHLFALLCFVTLLHENLNWFSSHLQSFSFIWLCENPRKSAEPWWEVLIPLCGDITFLIAIISLRSWQPHWYTSCLKDCFLYQLGWDSPVDDFCCFCGASAITQTVTVQSDYLTELVL